MENFQWHIGTGMAKCVSEIEKLLQLCNFVHAEAVKAFFDATVVNMIQKPNTETDTPALRIETFLRQLIEGTTTGNVDSANRNVDSAKQIDCFLEELMDIYNKAADKDAKAAAISEMGQQTSILLQRIGHVTDATVKPKLS